MKKLYFKQNNIIIKNNFTKALKKEIKKMLNGYFKSYYNAPLNFEIFDKEISDLVIRTQEEQDIKKKEEKKKIRSFKYISLKSSWKGNKFIK